MMTRTEYIAFALACGGDCSRFEDPERVDVPGVNAVIAGVEDTFSGMAAVRRLLDMCVGASSNPWHMFRRQDDSGLFGDGEDGFRMLPALEDFWWRSDLNRVKKVCFQDGMICGFALGNGCRDMWYDLASNILDHPPIAGVDFGWTDPLARQRAEDSIVMSYLRMSSEEIVARARGLGAPDRALLASSTPEPAVARALAGDEDPMVRAVAAGNRVLPSDAKRALASDSSAGVRRALAGNVLGHSYYQQYGNEMYGVVGSLVSDRDPVVRLNAVRSCRVPVEMLDGIVRGDIRDVRMGVAYSRFTDPVVFERLLDDPDPLVRATMCCNPMVPEYVVTKLSHDGCRSVRAEAALSCCSREVLAGLLDDPDGAVRGHAALRLASM